MLCLYELGVLNSPDDDQAVVLRAFHRLVLFSGYMTITISRMSQRHATHFSYVQFFTNIFDARLLQLIVCNRWKNFLYFLFSIQKIYAD